MEDEDRLRLKLYTHALAAPAEEIKNALLAAIECNRAVTIKDLLPPLKCDLRTWWPKLTTACEFVTDVEAWIHQKRTLLSYRISQIIGCTKSVGGAIASFIFPEWHEASRFNIALEYAQWMPQKANISYLYAWEEHKDDFRDQQSTYVCVKDKSSLLPMDEKAMWRLRPAGVDKNGVDVFWIQQVGSRAPGKVSNGYLHAWEVKKYRDYRDKGSTRLCVNENVYKKSSLFRIFDDGRNKCKIQMIGKRKRGRRRRHLLGPQVHDFDRDPFSTYAYVHDGNFVANSCWRLHVAEGRMR